MFFSHQALNTNVDVVTYDQRLTHDNAKTLIQSYDIVGDNSDNFATHYLVNDAFFELKKSKIYCECVSI